MCKYSEVGKKIDMGALIKSKVKFSRPQKYFNLIYFTQNN